MKRLNRAAFSAMLLASAALFATSPAKADVGIGFSFGYDGGSFSDSCDYYDYYDVAPPWGLPPDYCEYPVYFEPVYWGGNWYRGPIYYRWTGGERWYWLHGGWRRDEWRGSRPSIRWTDRGGWHGRDGWSGRPGFGYSGGNRGWSGGGYYRQGGDWGGNSRNWDGPRNGWNRGGNGPDNRGGDRGWNGSGPRDGDRGGWNGPRDGGGGNGWQGRPGGGPSGAGPRDGGPRGDFGGRGGFGGGGHDRGGHH